MTVFGAVSYAVVSLLYAVLTALLFTSYRLRSIGMYLIVACIVSTAWGAILALYTAEIWFNIPALFLAEILRGGAWLIFLVVLATRIGVGRFVCRFAIAVWLARIVNSLRSEEVKDAGLTSRIASRRPN